MCLASGVPDRGTGQLIKLCYVFRCQIGQIGTLAVVPHLLHWIKVWRKGRQLFNAHVLGPGSQVSPQYRCLMDAPPIHDEHHPSADTARKGVQESDHILDTDVFLVEYSSRVQSGID